MSWNRTPIRADDRAKQGSAPELVKATGGIVGVAALTETLSFGADFQEKDNAFPLNHLAPANCVRNFEKSAFLFGNRGPETHWTVPAADSLCGGLTCLRGARRRSLFDGLWIL